LSILAVLAAPALAEGPSKAELNKLGKAAAVYIETGKGSGSGFCIHASGLFVTNAHVVAGAETVTLVLDPSLKSQKVVKAKVLRVDKEHDLALLRVDEVKDLPTLPLGAIEGLAETQEVIAFGYPFGKALAEAKEYPAVSVNAGSITSLRQKNGSLNAIQVDVALNHGNSGGPVIDHDGKVIGVVVAGIPGSGVNFIIPVSHVTGFLAKPDLDFTPPAVTKATINSPLEFKARAVSLIPGGKPFSLELVLTGEDGKERTFPMEKGDDGFRVKAVPLPPPAGPVTLRAVFTYANGSVTGRVADRSITVAGKPVKLSELRGLRWTPAAGATDADGKALEGAVGGLESVEVDLGKETVRLKLDGVQAAQLERIGGAASVACVVVVKQDDKEVARLSRTLSVNDPVAEAPRDPTVGPTTPIQPPAIDGDKVIRTLPAAYDALCVGGGGRFLIFHLPKVRKLAIFDANEAKVVKYIDVAEDNVKFAAGQDKLLVALPGAKVLQRWSLATFTREGVGAWPVGDEVKSLLMGSASLELALMNGRFVSLRTLKPLPIKYPKDEPLDTNDDRHCRMSPDGRTLAAWTPGSSPQFQRTAVLIGDEVKTYGFPGEANGHVQPGADGRLAFTGGGVFTCEGKPAGGDELKGKHFCIPSQRSGFYLTVRIFEPEAPNDKREGVELHLAGMAATIVKAPQVALWEGVNGWGREEITLDQRIHLIPEAKLIVALPPSNDSLVLHHFDAEAALEKSDLKYMFVSSQPETTAKRGQPYTYQTWVKSKKGGFKVKLESGPDSMKVTADGKVTWDVPGDFKGEADVLLSATDADGQECFQSFKIAVGE
jgi:hypothetical protein